MGYKKFVMLNSAEFVVLYQELDLFDNHVSFLDDLSTLNNFEDQWCPFQASFCRPNPSSHDILGLPDLPDSFLSVFAYDLIT